MIQWQQFVSGSTLMVLSQVVTAVSHWTEENFKWRDMWPSMVTHTRNLCSAFNPSKVHTQTVNTHTPWTHTRSSGQPFMLWRPGSSWGFSALLKGLTSVVVLKVERERWTFTLPTDNSCRTRDSNPQPRVTSPTLYPLGHDCPLRWLRPRLN